MSRFPCALLLALLWAATAHAAGGELDERYAAAYRKALDARDALEKSPSTARRDLEQAAQELRAITQVDAEYPPAHFGLGVALRALGRCSEGDAAFEAYLDIVTSDPDLAPLAGRVERERENWPCDEPGGASASAKPPAGSGAGASDRSSSTSGSSNRASQDRGSSSGQASSGSTSSGSGDGGRFSDDRGSVDDSRTRGQPSSSSTADSGASGGGSRFDDAADDEPARTQSSTGSAARSSADSASSRDRDDDDDSRASSRDRGDDDDSRASSRDRDEEDDSRASTRDRDDDSTASSRESAARTEGSSTSRDRDDERASSTRSSSGSTASSRSGASSSGGRSGSPGRANGMIAGGVILNVLGLALDGLGAWLLHRNYAIQLAIAWEAGLDADYQLGQLYQQNLAFTIASFAGGAAMHGTGIGLLVAGGRERRSVSASATILPGRRGLAMGVVTVRF